MYLCVRRIKFPSFYDLCIGFWRCSESVVFLCFILLYILNKLIKFCKMFGIYFWYNNKVKSIQKYHTLGTSPKSNTQIVDRGKFDTSYTQIHDAHFSEQRSLWLGISVKMTCSPTATRCFSTTYCFFSIIMLVRSSVQKPVQ
jgi:hypothetical protein